MDRGQARSFLSFDDRGEDEDESIGESCSKSETKTEVKDADVSFLNLKFKLDRDACDLDDVAFGRVIVSSRKLKEAQEKLNDRGPLKELTLDINFKSEGSGCPGTRTTKLSKVYKKEV